MKDTRIKLGIVGAGKMGTLHLEKFLRLPEAQVLGLYDTHPEHGENLEAKWGVKSYPALEELLFDLDAVVIATPNRAHYSIARQALQSGLHVFLEKPIAERASEGEELVRLARERDRILQIGFLERMRFEALAVSFRSSPVRFIEAHRLSSSLGRDPNIDVVTDLMIHDLDLALWLIGEEPSFISAIGVPVLTSQFDIANVRLEFPSGAIANLSASRVSARPSRKLRIFTLESYSSFDFTTNSAEVFSRGSDGQIERRQSEAADFDALQEQARGFLAAIQGTRPPLASGDEGLQALRLVEAVRRKIDERAAWALPSLPSQDRGFSPGEIPSA